VISGLAFVALVVLSVSLVRMINRFLELKVREGAESQLKSLGMMAASLAHEIRNPPGGIKGLTQLAQEDLPSDHTTQLQLQTVYPYAFPDISTPGYFQPGLLVTTRIGRPDDLSPALVRVPDRRSGDRGRCRHAH
jgi:signal transduction histidine kinase